MEDARWSENVEDVQSFPSAGFIWWFCHCLYKIGTFYCFELQFLRVQPCWFALYQWRAEKVASWCICLTFWLCSHHHWYRQLDTKVAAHLVMFLLLESVVLYLTQSGSPPGHVFATLKCGSLQAGPQIAWKTDVCVFSFFQFPLIVSVMLLCFGAALKAKVCWISVPMYSGAGRTLPPIEHYPHSLYNSNVFCLKKGDRSRRQSFIRVLLGTENPQTTSLCSWQLVLLRSEGVSPFCYRMVLNRAAVKLLVEDFACSSDDAPDDMFLGMFFSRRGITALTHSRYFHQVSGSFCVCTCIRTHACMHAQVHACKGMCELKECKFWYLCTAIMYRCT